MEAHHAVKLGAAINDLVASGKIKAPVAIGRSFRWNSSRNAVAGQPAARAANSDAASDAVANSPDLADLLHAGRGVSWLSVQGTGERVEGCEPRAAFVVIDGKPKTAERVGRLITKDFAF
jgi:urocanate hydratase